LILCLFAARNGQQKVQKRNADIEKVKTSIQQSDDNMQLLLDSLKAGLPVAVPSWQHPDIPAVVGNYYPRVAAMPPAPLALIATGQSDLFTHYVQPTLREEAMLMNFTELSSPVQLLFGSFDLSFVLIYLLPLIVIAFTFDLLAADREQGSLRLLATQPLRLASWLLQRSVLRFALLALILGLSLKLSLWSNGISLSTHWNDGLAQLLALSFAYLLFWFGLAFVVNLLGRSSAYNAIALLGIWVGLVLLVPAVLNQTANTLYPVPSRARMINDMRVMKAEADREQDQIMDEYLRDHPELAGLVAGGSASTDGYWQRYFAAQDIIKKRMQPLIEEYDGQLDRQQQWVQRLRLLSPALLLQDGLQEIAGTASRHYRDYRRQVIDFAGQWRAFFLPMIFKDEKIDDTVLTQLPEFRYREPDTGPHFGISLSMILLYGSLLFGLGLGVFNRRRKEKLLLG
jgi:ABC-2 type transport system permease protein